MSDPEAAWRVINNLNGLNIRGHEVCDIVKSRILSVCIYFISLTF
jgi:hypothetical protein